MNAATPPPVPRTFVEYLRSFGPGIVVVLTWLGAGDIVEMSVAGSTYGYSLMWVLVVAVFLRFVLVSLIARYQLCNPHGEGVLDGLARVHPIYAPILLVAAVVMAHVYQAYMTVGSADVLRNVFGVGQTWQWALMANGVALLLVFRPAYGLLEGAFKVFLALLSISFLGCAAWVGVDAGGVLRGLTRWELPEQQGPFAPLLVAVGMIGAVGGSMMNLVYPYFLEAKGWRGTQYRRVQTYDLLLGIVAMIVLNLAVWTLGAELLYPGVRIQDIDDLPSLLTGVIGRAGRWLFYLGVFAAIYTSVLGHAAGLGYLGSHAWLRWRAGTAPLPPESYRRHPLYRAIVLWSLISPLVWALPGMPDFVTLTLLANAAQVVTIPLLAGGIWWMTASERCIGREHRNRAWENAVMALLFVLAVAAARGSVMTVVGYFRG